jgi:hypothetical protein
MKVLLIDSGGIGDVLSYSIPFARLLVEQSDSVDIWLRSAVCYDILAASGLFTEILGVDLHAKEIDHIFLYLIDPTGPYNTTKISPDVDLKHKLFRTLRGRIGTILDKDLKTKILKYDKVVIGYDSHFVGVFKRAIPPGPTVLHPIRFLNSNWAGDRYKPIKYFEEIGYTYDDRLLNFDINLLKKFYVDSHCGPKSLLLNCKSSDKCRTYLNHEKLRHLLEKEGFDVREQNPQRPLAENFHLVNQCKYILSVDTSTIWVAKCLGKTPFVILSGQNCTHVALNTLPEQFPYELINEIPPEEIVRKFLLSILMLL